ncbi:MAG: 23S rRNA (adenine(2503)-C(2))-methyltransferase RlmN [Bacteroidota bacterium]
MANNQLTDIKSLTLEELSIVIENFGEKKFRAKQIFEWLWKKNAKSFSEMSNIPKLLISAISEQYFIDKLSISYEQKSNDGTIKLGFSLHDSSLIEGVLIPAENRTTACISTQVGCAMRCEFCATAQLGFKRNLSVSEIYNQVVEINQLSLLIYKQSLSNIVIMGMGEPLLNYKNVKESISLLTSNNGMGMSPSRITLSTVGIPKMIRQLADDQIKYNLAISLHAATDQLRNQIIPANLNHTLSEISDALDYFHKKTEARITIEYLLLNNVNDSIEDATNLALFCRRFPVKVNLIEFNSVDGIRYSPSDNKKVEAFKNYLDSKNMIVNLRKSRGKDIDAACGQLANKIK